jgi:hypothetical protein
MNRSAWEIFQGATLSLARSGALKDRLTDAYRNHLASLDESELPWDLRQDFRSFNYSITREPPLLRGEDSVRATIRKMSNCEAEAAASCVVKMFCALQRSHGPTRPGSAATVVPLYIASSDARAAKG